MSVAVSIKPLGTFDVPDDNVYTFPSGLPGFPQCKRFALVEREEFRPFLWMVNLDQQDLAFLVIDPAAFFPGYRPRLAQEDLEVVGLSGNRDGLALLAIVTIPQDPARATANLRGPVILNPATRMGRQAILAGQEYSTRHPLLGGPEGGTVPQPATEGIDGAVPQSQGRRDRSAGPDS